MLMGRFLQRLVLCIALCSLAPAAVPVPAVKLHAHVNGVPPPPDDRTLRGVSWPPPAAYNATVKAAPNASTLDACQAACLDFANTAASPVSGWSRCQFFAFCEGSGCTLDVDAAEWAPKESHNCTSGRVQWAPMPCDVDDEGGCSYNGRCVDGLCECDAAWTGDRCQTLALEPTRRAAPGLRLVDQGRNTSTWGGAVLLDRETGLFHVWASEITRHCGIDAWTSNSRITHAVSNVSAAGPWSDRDIVVPVFAHEPNVVRGERGEWVMWYTGYEHDAPTVEQCTACTDGNTPATGECHRSPGADGAPPTYMIWAPHPTGPWSDPVRLFSDPKQKALMNADTNLAMVIKPDGSAVGIARTAGMPQGINTHLVTASHWRDADSYVGAWDKLLFPNLTRLPYAGLEDPSVYLDEAGVFHAVFHNQIEDDDQRLAGGHAYSHDGATWTFGGTSWSNSVQFDDGETLLFTRRERPHLVFGDMENPHKITHLSTGVQFGPDHFYHDGQDACFTLVQPVKQ